jgi:hypothetical protein
MFWSALEHFHARFAVSRSCETETVGPQSPAKLLPMIFNSELFILAFVREFSCKPFFYGPYPKWIVGQVIFEIHNSSKLKGQTLHLWSPSPTVLLYTPVLGQSKPLAGQSVAQV